MPCEIDMISSEVLFEPHLMRMLVIFLQVRKAFCCYGTIQIIDGCTVKDSNMHCNCEYL